MKNIYDYVSEQETNFQTMPITVVDGFEFHLPDHIRTTVLYKNSQLKTGKNDNKPVKNITRPLLNLQYRAEGFDVRDITLFIEDSYKYFMSFLVKKYHDMWALIHKIDDFIDDLVETYVDFGGVIVKKIKGAVPEVVKWESIAFCDQTNFLSGAFGFKHNYSVPELKDFEELGWGKKENGATISIDDLIVLAEAEVDVQQDNNRKTKTPSKYIEVYEVYGSFPRTFLQKEGADVEYKENDFVEQMHIIAYYKNDKGDKNGVTLFKAKEDIRKKFKILLRDEIFGRCVGLGGAEELFEPQVWTTYNLIRIKEMLDAVSKVFYKTNDKKFKRKNLQTESDHGDVFVLENGSDLTQVGVSGANVAYFDRLAESFWSNAQVIASASDPALGEEPKSGTPFKLQELVVSQGTSNHEYRKGKIARFVEEIYRDWIIPQLAEELLDNKVFMSDISMEEMEQIVDNVVVCKTNDFLKEKILNGEEIDEEEKELVKEKIRAGFMKNNKKFLEILEGELKNAPLIVKIDIAGKQKYLSGMTDKLVNIFKQLIATPQVLDDPRMMNIFNQIIEFSGFSPIGFYQKPKQQMQLPQQLPQQMPLQTNQLQTT